MKQMGAASRKKLNIALLILLLVALVVLAVCARQAGRCVAGQPYRDGGAAVPDVAPHGAFCYF